MQLIIISSAKLAAAMHKFYALNPCKFTSDESIMNADPSSLQTADLD
jgi:hypothetical protein